MTKDKPADTLLSLLSEVAEDDFNITNYDRYGDPTHCHMCDSENVEEGRIVHKTDCWYTRVTAFLKALEDTDDRSKETMVA